jgi:hypothetical protein
MGARTTWAIKTEKKTDAVTWLYSHWGGESKFEDTQRALAKAEPRWEDSTYGARIFISQIVGDQWDNETGFGITTGTLGHIPFEEEYDLAIVDFTTNTIIYGTNEFTFSEFVEYSRVGA